MSADIADALARYGYVAIFLVIAIECVGVPVPGETALITGSAFAAAGRLSIVGVIISAAAGAIVGSTGGYWLGRSGGVALVERYGRALRVTPARMQSVHEFFVRHGAWAVFIGRFIALLRAWAAILAGTGGMAFTTFTLYNVLGSIVWAAAFGTLGYLFGNSLPVLRRNVGFAALAVAAVAAIVMVGYLIRRRKLRASRASERRSMKAHRE